MRSNFLNWAKMIHHISRIISLKGVFTFYMIIVERNLFGAVDASKCFISDISCVSDNIGLTLFC
jgi:hypothetical protein